MIKCTVCNKTFMRTKLDLIHDGPNPELEARFERPDRGDRYRNLLCPGQDQRISHRNLRELG